MGSDETNFQEDGRLCRRLDFKIWTVLIFLCCFGAIMLYSTSAYHCSQDSDMKYNSLYLVNHQLIYMLAGFAAVFVLQYVDYRILDKLAGLIYMAGIVCIFLLLTPLGVEANGAVRWLQIGPIGFQVAEVVKISVIVKLASMVKHHSKSLGTVKMAAHLLVTGGIQAVLLFKISNDLSSAIVVLGITFGISFVCTSAVKFHLTIAAGVLIRVAVFVIDIARHMPEPKELKDLPFRVVRTVVWLDPERYRLKEGLQVCQALYAIGKGGILGEGLGNSVQKLGAIPEAYNDMIFAIICEELGIAGAVFLMFLLGYFCYQIFLVTVHAPDLFGAVLTMGVLFHVAIQSLINIAVSCNAIPNTGIGLPFISYGGTSVLCLFLETAMVMSVEWKRIGKEQVWRKRLH